MRKSTKNKNLDLRSRAEALLAQQQERQRETSTLDLQKLVHELGTHQIELEMQNEELRRAQLELETSRNKFAELYDFSPVGYFTIDARGLIKEVNLTGAEMLSLTRNLLLNKPFSLFVARADAEAYRIHHAEAFRLQTLQVCELRMVPKNAPQFYARLQSAASESTEDKTGLVRTVLIDVSDRKQLELEREQVITELQAALEKIKTLSGLLPICSACKKIRNDDGYWQQVEGYITQHTDVLFSHGLCPDCYDKAIQDFEHYNRNKKSRE